MNAIGIDVSKGKSTVTIRRPGDVVLMPPCDILCIEHTYRYYESGANAFFYSPARSDGSQKWVDFIHTNWHMDCVRSKSLNAFTERYQN